MNKILEITNIYLAIIIIPSYYNDNAYLNIYYAQFYYFKIIFIFIYK